MIDEQSRDSASKAKETHERCSSMDLPFAATHGSVLQDIHWNEDHLLLLSCFLYLALSSFLLLLANYSCLVNKAWRLDIGEGTLGYTSIHPPQGTVQQLSGGEGGELKNEHYVMKSLI